MQDSELYVSHVEVSAWTLEAAMNLRFLIQIVDLR